VGPTPQEKKKKEKEKGGHELLGLLRAQRRAGLGPFCATRVRLARLGSLRPVRLGFGFFFSDFF
jgi:hypothetical protein